MTTTSQLLDRNQAFAETSNPADLSPFSTLGTMILACVDPRVDPAHVLGLQLGDALVFRNNGGRVTQSFIDEISALVMMVARMTGKEPGFTIILMQHTQCGAQSFADPEFSALIKEKINFDVSETAITDQESDLRVDLNRLKDATHVPDSIRVAAVLYDVETGLAHEIEPEKTLAELRGR